jgi:hypothetical protein
MKRKGEQSSQYACGARDGFRDAEKWAYMTAGRRLMVLDRRPSRPFEASVEVTLPVVSPHISRVIST